MKKVLICLILLQVLLGWTLPAHLVFAGQVSEENINAAIGPPSQFRLFIADNGFRLAWKPSMQDPGMVTGYEIVRSGEFAGPYQRLAVVKDGVSEYLDESAAPDVVYFYKVRALAGDQYSHFSNIAGGERPSSTP